MTDSKFHCYIVDRELIINYGMSACQCIISGHDLSSVQYSAICLVFRSIATSEIFAV